MQNLRSLKNIQNSLGMNNSVVFSPDSVSGLTLWLKADAITASNDDPVTTWEDSGPVGNDVTQATTDAKPTYKTNQINSLPAVSFDGADFLADADATAHSGGFTIFAVIKRADTTEPRTFISLGSSNNSTDGRPLLTMYDPDAPTTSLHLNAAGAAGITDGDIPDAACIIQAYFDATDGFISVNGGSETTGAYSYSSVVGYLIGAFTTGLSQPWSGLIAEVIIYNSNIAAGTKVNVREYLAEKWAITLA